MEIDLTKFQWAIDWMDRALRETRETLAEADADKRYAVTRVAFMYIATRARCLPDGASLRANGNITQFDWQGIRAIAGLDPDLTLFDDWLALARKAVGGAA
jgi:hypothetical protein